MSSEEFEQYYNAREKQLNGFNWNNSYQPVDKIDLDVINKKKEATTPVVDSKDKKK